MRHTGTAHASHRDCACVTPGLRMRHTKVTGANAHKSLQVTFNANDRDDIAWEIIEATHGYDEEAAKSSQRAREAQNGVRRHGRG